MTSIEESKVSAHRSGTSLEKTYLPDIDQCQDGRPHILGTEGSLDLVSPRNRKPESKHSITPTKCDLGSDEI